MVTELAFERASPLEVVCKASKPDLGGLLNSNEIGFSLRTEVLVDELLIAEELRRDTLERFPQVFCNLAKSLRVPLNPLFDPIDFLESLRATVQLVSLLLRDLKRLTLLLLVFLRFTRDKEIVLLQPH